MKFLTVFLISFLIVTREVHVQASGWDAYIDTLIGHSKDAQGTAHVDKAAIIGLDGGAAWTSSSPANALKLTSSERTTIATAFKSKDFTTFMNDGINMEGVKYQFLREEDDKLVLGKKKNYGAVTLQASKTAIVMAHCPEGKQQGNANKAVDVIADYLESLGM